MASQLPYVICVFNPHLRFFCRFWLFLRHISLALVTPITILFFSPSVTSLRVSFPSQTWVSRRVVFSVLVLFCFFAPESLQHPCIQPSFQSIGLSRAYILLCLRSIFFLCVTLVITCLILDLPPVSLD